MPKPYADARSKGEQVRTMFNRIAHSYDLLNHTLSAGVDRLWRRAAVDTLERHARRPIHHLLDVATGTGDLALSACRRLPECRVLAIDIADAMLDVARRKTRKAHLQQRIDFRNEDCAALPLPDASIDAVASAFALRNFHDLPACLGQMQRVLKPRGTLVLIDLCAPRHAPMRHVFHAYKRWLMPLAGRLIAHDRQAYAYLPASMEAVPQGEDMDRLLRQAGFHDVRHRYLTTGMCVMYTATK